VDAGANGYPANAMDGSLWQGFGEQKQIRVG
jgi:hypothetical protein